MNEYTLWYRQPAKRWLNGLPIGNGTIGAMVMGGIFITPFVLFFKN